MENAGVKLTEALYSHGKVREHFSELDHDVLQPFTDDLQQLWMNDDRLSVRLGSQAVEVRLYREAIHSLMDARQTLENAVQNGISDADIRALENCHKTALEAQYDFYDAASRRIGPGDVERDKSPGWRPRLPGKKNEPPQQLKP